jgi:hypothetical protein
MRKLIAPLLILVAAVLSAPPTSVADPGCERISLSGQTQLNFVTGKIEGVLTGTADGDPISIFSRTAILAQEERGAVSFLTTSHTFTIVGGEHDGVQLTTLDNARLVPTPTAGVSHAVSNVDIVSGGSGFLVANGSIDFRAGITATWKHIHGQVCGL